MQECKKAQDAKKQKLTCKNAKSPECIKQKQKLTCKNGREVPLSCSTTQGPSSTLARFVFCFKEFDDNNTVPDKNNMKQVASSHFVAPIGQWFIFALSAFTTLFSNPLLKWRLDSRVDEKEDIKTSRFVLIKD